MSLAIGAGKRTMPERRERPDLERAIEVLGEALEWPVAPPVVLHRDPAPLLFDWSDEVTVLLLEDDPAFADMCQLKLEMDGYTVRLARDGHEALEMLHGEDLPDMVFLDISLPEMNGIALLTQLRKDRRTASLPVVILSNDGDDDLVRRSLALGALDYRLVKPNLTPEDISNAVEQLSAGQRLSRSTQTDDPRGS